MCSLTGTRPGWVPRRLVSDGQSGTAARENFHITASTCTSFRTSHTVHCVGERSPDKQTAPHGPRGTPQRRARGGCAHSAPWLREPGGAQSGRRRAPPWNPASRSVGRCYVTIHSCFCRLTTYVYWADCLTITANILNIFLEIKHGRCLWGVALTSP